VTLDCARVINFLQRADFWLENRVHRFCTNACIVPCRNVMKRDGRIGYGLMAMSETSVTDFERVLECEHTAIQERHKNNHGLPISKIEGSTSAETLAVYDTVGLALSGGGIRSAAVALGALQALNKGGVLEKVDYLSTVSGGGYLGTSLTATMSVTGGKFVFVDEVRSPHTSAVAHLRNFSNYLLAGGKYSRWSAAAIIVRGLVANLAIVLPFILFLVAGTIAYLWYLDHLSIIPYYLPYQFDLTYSIAWYGFILFILWGIAVSFDRSRQVVEKLKLSVAPAIYLAAIAVVFFVELQIWLLSPRSDSAHILKFLQVMAFVGLPVVAIAAVTFQRYLGVVAERGRTTSKPKILLSSVAARIVIWLAAAELPLLLWLAYLRLSSKGIALELEYQVNILSFGYLFLGFIFFLLAACLRPNPLSLHGLYRDRLKAAFLFNPNIEPGKTYEPLSDKDSKLSALSAKFAPYQLINAALNIRGSSYANQRGRDADFFLFSPEYVGSVVTGYVRTKQFEEVQQGFDLATAMAISGAAVSSSMGAHTIRPLTPTLALLNIRLGYWLRNPKRLDATRGWMRRLRNVFLRSSSSLWSEMTGQLYTDKSDEVYVTDGGHIENLGLYELLHRGCQLIICVDAEADPEMRFGSFMALQRYASIDLGVRITLPWNAIQATTVKWMGYDPLTGTLPQAGTQETRGPHAAVGIICYPGGETGFLIYIKASLTGDEPDYVLDYARRYPEFPHERTGKQFFNEEQFEVYRTLGFHMTEGVLVGRDRVECLSLGEAVSSLGRKGGGFSACLRVGSERARRQVCTAYNCS
jgi:hypothetical protein